MSIIITRESPAHWYTRDGKPSHMQPKAKGDGITPTTVAHARKLGLVPSVTSILGIVAKPGLEAWKIEQGIMAALTLPHLDGETTDAFAHRVAADASEQVGKASDLGSSIHAAIEDYASNKTFPSQELAPYLAPFLTWFDSNVEGVGLLEKIVVDNTEGYAGKLDATLKVNGKWGLYDFKSQRCPKGKPIWYETWPLQLEAYARASMEKVQGIYSIVIPTTVEHAGVHVHEWPALEREGYWEAFRAARTLWMYVKGYDPRRGA